MQYIIIKDMTLLYSFLEHHATFLHFDFRIAINGIALSFAISPGLFMRPNVEVLAVEMPVHSQKYMFTDRTIPPGQYGAGEVRVWDKGLLQTCDDVYQALREGCVTFSVMGSNLKGRFKLMIYPDHGRDWAFVKLPDEYADPQFVLKTVL